MDLIIKNGILIDNNGCYQANLAIAEGKIKAIFQGNKNFQAERVIDASKKMIFPGVVDTHVHFQLQDLGKIISTDTFASGTQAAACGGVTTVIDFADQTRGISPLKGFNERKKNADSQVAIDYSLHVSKTDIEFLDEIPTLISEGVASFKFFTTYSWRNLDLNDAELLELFQEVKKCRGMVMGHCENDSMVINYRDTLILEGKRDSIFHAHSRPHIVEEEAIQRVMLFAKKTGIHLHLAHITTKEGSDLLYQAKQQGLFVTGETCPHYLLLNEREYKGPEGYLNLMSPPLRHVKDQQALLKRVIDNTINQITTDHCEFSRASKGNGELPFHQVLNGIPGIETSLPLIHDLMINKHKLTYPQLISLMSSKPAKIFGLYPQKGSLRIGTDADIVIFDPCLEKRITPEILHYSIDWNPFLGRKVIGWPIMTIFRGHILCENGKFIGPQNKGRYLKCSYKKALRC
ncbi:MAG: dihydropyrimidinase [Candidatus Heimdallarchaeota archaeon]|nr:MAG: dihydropyrimidinase [Candidatus Heimdallarchaeota archaeon]